MSIWVPKYLIKWERILSNFSGLEFHSQKRLNASLTIRKVRLESRSTNSKREKCLQRNYFELKFKKNKNLTYTYSKNRNEDGNNN